MAMARIANPVLVLASPWVDVLSRQWYGNSVLRWASAAAVAAVALLALLALRRILRGRIGRLVQRTATEWDDLVVQLLQDTSRWFFLALALYAGSRVLALETSTRDLANRVAAVVLVLQGGIWLSRALRLMLESYRRNRLREDPTAVTTMQAVTFVGRGVVWSVVVLLILANAGIEIGPLIAGLGVGGIAVALAVQAILGDLLASLSIVLDKPFVVGDFLILGDLMGSVESIGLKTTRIRSLTGEQLIFSNGDLLNSRIRNFGRMRERRVVFSIGVTYQTPREKLVRIPEILREAVTSQEGTRFDRAHFKSFGDFALLYETVYYVSVPDYNTYMDLQQAINLHIHGRFEEEGIEFAYPTQTLFVEKPAGRPV